MRSDYISDGYTEEGYIAEQPGMNGELRFTFRPFLIDERAVITNGAEKLDVAMRERKYAAAVASKLKSWTLLDGGGKLVEITPETVAHVNPPVLVRLTDIVMKMRPSDIDPRWGDKTKSEVSNAAFDAVVAGVPISNIMEASNEKNSG
jgi:hypothetical protein